jgi:phosphoribosyl-ATP pyrophosphohydrolase
MADLIYHSMTLLALRGIDWQEVEAELARRMT